jgi:hypothetical protein
MPELSTPEAPDVEVQIERDPPRYSMFLRARQSLHHSLHCGLIDKVPCDMFHASSAPSGVI